MATVQFYPMRVTTGLTSTPTYLDAVEDGSSGWAADASISGCRIRAAGVAKNLIVKVDTAPGSGKSIVYTYQLWNGSAFADTSLVLTLADLATTGTSTGSATVAVGDIARWKRVLVNAPTLSAMLMTWELHHLTANLNVHMGTSVMSGTLTQRIGLFRCGHASSANAAQRSQVISAPGTLIELDYTLTVAPGTAASGKSFAITAVLNNVVQDGTSGTPNTTVTILDTALTGRWSGSLARVAGDRLCIQIVPTGTPTAGKLLTSVLYAPTTDGEANLCGLPAVNLPTSGTTYFTLSQDSLSNSGPADVDAEQLAGVTPCEWRQFRMWLSTTVAASGSIAFTLRKNGSSAPPTVTFAATQQAQNDGTHVAATTSSDTVAMQYACAVTPGGIVQPAWAFTTYALTADTGGGGSGLQSRRVTMNAKGYNYAFPVVPSDTIDYPRLTDAIYVGGAGIVQAVLENGTIVPFTCEATQVLPVKVKRVHAAGTTATLMNALYYI